MNPFGGMIRMDRRIPAGLGGRRKTSQLNPFRGAPLGAIQPQYHLPELPQLNIKTKGPSGISKGIPRGKHLTGQAGQAQITQIEKAR